MVLKRESKVVGTCGFDWWSVRDACAGIGYMLARPYWGRGYTTEAVREVVGFGFRAMALNRVEAPVLPENAASWRVLEKVGMRREGVMRQRLFLKDAFRDVALYSMLRAEWSGT